MSLIFLQDSADNSDTQTERGIWDSGPEGGTLAPKRSPYFPTVNGGELEPSEQVIEAEELEECIA